MDITETLLQTIETIIRTQNMQNKILKEFQQRIDNLEETIKASAKVSNNESND